MKNLIISLIVLFLFVSCSQKRNSAAFDAEKYSQISGDDIATYSFDMKFDSESYEAPIIKSISYSYDGDAYFSAEIEDLVETAGIKELSFKAEIPVNFLKIEMFFEHGVAAFLLNGASHFMSIHENNKRIFFENPELGLIKSKIGSKSMYIKIDIRDGDVSFPGVSCLSFGLNCSNVTVPMESMKPQVNPRILEYGRSVIFD